EPRGDRQGVPGDGRQDQLRDIGGAMKPLHFVIACAAAAATLPPAFAVDVGSLSEGAPLSVDDAGTPDPGTLELVVPFDVSRKDSGDYSVGFTPKLKYGIAQDWEVSLSAPLLAGAADRT